MESFGLHLRRLRKARDLTQEQLATSVSCSRYTIRKIEADERRPSRHLAQRLVRELSVASGEREAFLAAARRTGPTPSPLVGDRATCRAEAGALDRARPFVGRDVELAALQGLLRQAAEGRGHVVLLEGEPGIGKSRLIAEIPRLTGAEAAEVIATRCYEIERAVPYQSVTDVATQAVDRLRERGGLAELGAQRAELAALLPELASGGDTPAGRSELPEAHQARLFRALLQLLDLAAGSAALVLVVDDLQWADEASAQFLHWLARQARQRRLIVLYAMRDENLGVDERLAALVHSVRKEPHAVHLPLQRLDIAATRALLGRSGDDVLAERLHRETEGHPLFLVSLLQVLEHGHELIEAAQPLPLPQALRASVRERLARVPAEARATLEAAAVLGRQFDLATLARVTGESPARLLPALDALHARHLLREDAEGNFDFTHDKLREVAYLEIGTSRRIEMHRAVAAALATSGVGAAQLAAHFERGRLWPQTLAAMARAGQESLRWFALHDALHWFDRALALAESRPETATERQRIELHAQRGAARAQAGQLDGALSDLQCVVAAARVRNDRRDLRDALIALGMAYRRADRYREAMAALDEALRESRALGDDSGAADTLYHLGTVAWSNGRNRDATACHEQAVAICTRLGLGDLVAVQAWHGRGEAHFNALEPAEAVRCYEESIRLARALGDKGYECENEMMVGFACTGYLGLADYARAESAFERALAIAGHLDLRWHMSPALLGLEHVRACRGKYGQAWTGMERTLQWMRSAGQVRYELIACDLMAGVLLDVDLPERAIALLERALRLASEQRLQFWWQRLTATLAIATVRAGQATSPDVLAEALTEARAHGELLHAARCLEALAELACRRGDTAATLQHADALYREAECGGLGELVAVARRWRGEALAAQGQRELALDELLHAHDGARAIGRLRLLLDTSLALGRLGVPVGDETRQLQQALRAGVHGSPLEASTHQP